MHHKRKGPKSTRAGCMMCKPQKHQGTSRINRMQMGDRRRYEAGTAQLKLD